MYKLLLAVGMMVITNSAYASDTLGIKSLRCNYEKGFFTTLDKGKINSETVNDGLELVFDSINYKTSKARLIGNTGAADVTVLENGSTLHFLELTPGGNLNTTTIYLLANANDNPIKFFSVTSRHIGFPNDPMISQYYGYCRILDS